MSARRGIISWGDGRYRHGTRAMYVEHKCRCPYCSFSDWEYQRIKQLRLKGTEPPEHGLSGYTNYQCRCDVCKAARRDWGRDYRKRQSA